MPTWALILIIVVVVAVVVAAATAATRQRRTAALRQKFGPEYERTVGAHENQRAAEAELRDRQRQRARLDLKPLPAASRARYVEEWRQVQERFVDEPVAAVGAADGLLYRLMAERGYPMQDFSAQSDLISVDHPHVVENYRVAHQIHQQASVQQASTEDLREALLRYRSLFEEMLRADAGDGAADSPAQSRPADSPAQTGPADSPAQSRPADSQAEAGPAAVTDAGSHVVIGGGRTDGTGESLAEQPRQADESFAAQPGPGPRGPGQSASGWEADDEAR